VYELYYFGRKRVGGKRDLSKKPFIKKNKEKNFCHVLVKRELL